MVFLPKPGSNSKLCIAFHCPVFHLFCRGVGFVVTRRLRPQALPFNPEIWLRHCLLQGCAEYTGSDPPLIYNKSLFTGFLKPPPPPTFWKDLARSVPPAQAYFMHSFTPHTKIFFECLLCAGHWEIQQGTQLM